MAHNRYPARLLNVYDGDTLTLIVDIWPGQWIKAKLRLNGIDTPEKRTRVLCEKAMAIVAKNELESFLLNKKLYITDIFHGKYAGRIIGDLYADGLNVSEYMLSTGYAIPYSGGKRSHVWCT